MPSFKIRFGYDGFIVLPFTPENTALVNSLMAADICEEQHSSDYRVTYLVRKKKGLTIEIGEFEVLDAKPVEHDPIMPELKPELVLVDEVTD